MLFIVDLKIASHHIKKLFFSLFSFIYFFILLKFYASNDFGTYIHLSTYVHPHITIIEIFLLILHIHSFLFCTLDERKNLYLLFFCFLLFFRIIFSEWRFSFFTCQLRKWEKRKFKVHRDRNGGLTKGMLKEKQLKWNDDRINFFYFQSDGNVRFWLFEE